MLKRRRRALAAYRTALLTAPPRPSLALMARAYNQAQKFGAELAIPDEVELPPGTELRELASHHDRAG